MRSAGKRSRQKAQREATRGKHQMDPSPPTPLSSPGSPDSSAETQYGAVLDMVRKLNSELGLITMDNDKIRTVYEKLLEDNKDHDSVMCDLTRVVKRNLDCPLEHLPQPDAFKPDAFKPHPIIRPDHIDNYGNLRATDIGITWAGSETFLHGGKVVGSDVAGQPTRSQPATSTPYQPVRDHGGFDISTPRQPSMLPTCLQIPDTCIPLRRNTQEGRQSYRSAAPIQRFNNKSLNWPSWFRHFWAVADVHGWDANQNALQLVSYLDETAMNVAQKLGDVV